MNTSTVASSQHLSRRVCQSNQNQSLPICLFAQCTHDRCVQRKILGLSCIVYMYENRRAANRPDWITSLMEIGALCAGSSIANGSGPGAQHRLHQRQYECTMTSTTRTYCTVQTPFASFHILWPQYHAIRFDALFGSSDTCDQLSVFGRDVSLLA